MRYDAMRRCCCWISRYGKFRPAGDLDLSARLVLKGPPVVWGLPCSRTPSWLVLVVALAPSAVSIRGSILPQVRSTYLGSYLL